MAVSNTTFQLVRQRADYACEYCGARETDTRALLTIDHFQPESRGGSSEVDNLVYACYRCNLYKSAHWADPKTDTPLWNPRTGPQSLHMIEMPDGRLLAITDAGRSTIRILRLNREQAVNARLKAQQDEMRRAVLAKLTDVAETFGQLQTDQSDFLQEYQNFLKEQLRLLRAIDEDHNA